MSELGISDLTGRTALVTGAGQRIGAGIASALAASGVNVVIHYHQSAASAEQMAERLRAGGVKSWTLQADLADPAQAEALVGRAVEQAGAVDILVNCASIFPADRLMSVTAEDLYANINVNALAPLMLARGLARLSRAGSIVNLLDTRITSYDAEHAAYHLSKRMLFSLTRMLALELAPGFRVNAVAPGLILPPAGKDESYLRQLESTNALQAHGSVEGVAEAVLFLLRSDFITGQVIFVDGGRHLKGNLYA